MKYYYNMCLKFDKDDIKPQNEIPYHLQLNITESKYNMFRNSGIDNKTLLKLKSHDIDLKSISSCELLQYISSCSK